jgi:AsmA family/AsmA-like C-terminal region
LRILILIAVVLVALVVAGVGAVAHFVVWDDYRNELTAQAEAMTGRSVVIEGPIDLDLLPQPTLTLTRTTLASRSDMDDGVHLEVDRLDLKLKPLPLLRGRLDVQEVRLVRPVLTVEPATDGRPYLMQLAGPAAWLPLTPDGPSRVSVVDGRAALPEFTLGRVSQLEQVNLDLSTVEPSGALVLGSTFTLNGQPFRGDARFGRLSEEQSSTLRLELATDGLGDAGASTLTFGGVVWWRADAPRLRGELAVAGADARSTIGSVAKALGQEIVPMPPWLAAPFQLSGRIGLEDDRLDLAGFALGLDGTELSGRLRLILAAVPEIDLEIAAPRLGFAQGTTADNLERSLAPFLALASSVRGEVGLAVGEVDGGGAAVRRLRASVQLSGDGSATISDARAVLPGHTDVGFTGRLTGAGADTELRGALTAVTEDLRGALAWLDLSPDQVAEGRLNSLSLASDLALRRGAWRFSEIELRIDATRVTGSVAVNPRPRPQIAADLVLDRFDVDAYWPDQAATALLARLTGPLGAIDAAIQAQLARLTWRGVHLQDIGLAARSVNGRLMVNELMVGDLAATEARVTGQLDLAAGAFDLSAELRGVHPARLLRRLGFEPLPLLARLKPLMVEAVATGSLEAAYVELEASDGAGKVDLSGEIGWTDQEAHYDLDVEAGHPDYHGLLQDFGAGWLPGERSAAPLSLAGKVQREVGGASSVAGTARLGETSFTGKVAWQGDGRPEFAARLSVGEPTAPVLGGLLELSGLRLEWPAPDGGFRGRWSERPLALPLLDQFDGELVLSSKGGLAGDGLELSARLEEGRLTLEHVSLALWQGRLQGQLSFDVRRPLPYLIAALDLQGFDPAELAAWLGVPPIVAGPATLHLQATGAGDNVHALVGSLIGEVELAAPDGPVLSALPEDFVGQQSDGSDAAAEPAGVAASFALERGVLLVQPTHLDFGEITARLEGAIDLYLWAVDLTLESAAGSPVLKMVGPLHRPQVRIIGTAGPEQASPAPSTSP